MLLCYSCYLMFEKFISSTLVSVISYVYQLYQRMCLKVVLFFKLFLPSELLTIWNMMHNYILPYLSFLRHATVQDLLRVIKLTAQTQTIPPIPGRCITKESKSFISDAYRYSLMATAVYCDHIKMNFVTHFHNYDLPRLLRLSTKLELYKQYFCSYSHIHYEDLYYFSSSFPALHLSQGGKANCPTVCICRDTIKKRICVVIKGTSTLNDIILDLAVEPIGTSQGFVHEGAGKCAIMLVHDPEFNQHLKRALESNPGYSIVTIGHSLGASVASLLCIFWRKYQLYTEYNPQCIGFAAFPCISKGFQDKGLDFIHIFVNEDDNVPRFNSDQGYLLSEHIRLCYENRSERMTTIKESIDEYHHNYYQYYESTDEKPLNFILPGNVYYMNPCLSSDELYYEYEQSKLFIYHHLWSYIWSNLLRTHSTQSKPSCKVFSGNEFPHSVRLHPWFWSHHACENYEVVLHQISSTLI